MSPYDHIPLPVGIIAAILFVAVLVGGVAFGIIYGIKTGVIDTSIMCQIEEVYRYLV